MEHELMYDGGIQLPLEASSEPGLREAAERLGAAVLEAADAGSNVVCSPLSLLLALCMLRTGASGETAEEMDAKLGLPPDGGVAAAVGFLAELAEFDRGLPADTSVLPERPLLNLANALFFGGRVVPGASFRAKVAEYFGADVLPLESIRPEERRAAMDSWVRRHTAGEVSEAPGEPPGETGLSLLNTVFFAASWEAPFEEDRTTARVFRLRDGSAVEVPMMRRWLDARYAEGPGWRALELPYSEGFAMQLLLPRAGSPMRTKALAAACEALAEAPYMALDLRLPRWKHGADLDVLPVLASLGLERTLGPCPDFESIAPGTRITAAKQAVTMQVAEAGTVAAAVTHIEVMATGIPDPARPKHVSFSRPFLYQVVHEESGMPLFMGRVEDPR